MEVSVAENNVKRTQLRTESFSGVWSISYKFNNDYSIDYTGNLFGPMRLPLLGKNDPRDEYSPCLAFKIFN
jgi:outer membrane receptor for ferrienterochelin and colicins